MLHKSVLPALIEAIRMECAFILYDNAIAAVIVGVLQEVLFV